MSTLRYNGEKAPILPPDCHLQQDGPELKITYDPASVPTADLIALLQSAGPIREMTIQGQNVDHLIAAMYKELDL